MALDTALLAVVADAKATPTPALLRSSTPRAFGITANRQLNHTQEALYPTLRTVRIQAGSDHRYTSFLCSASERSTNDSSETRT